MSIHKLADLLLRFLSRPRNYYGTIILKYQNGQIKNIVAEDSFNMNYLNEKQIKIGENEMSFTKYGTSTDKDKDSSKIISELKVDEEKNIVKESKIKKENAEDKKD